MIRVLVCSRGGLFRWFLVVWFLLSCYVCLFGDLSLCLSVCLSASLSVCLFLFLLVCLSVFCVCSEVSCSQRSDRGSPLSLCFCICLFVLFVCIFVFVCLLFTSVCALKVGLLESRFKHGRYCCWLLPVFLFFFSFQLL